MSLLEDIFLEDEANEAQELERVIEGDEYDERPRSVSLSGDESDGGKREDEAEEDKRRVDPSSTKTTRVTRNPRFLLNPARLTGPRGIQVIPEHFKDFKFKGKGHEKDDVDMVLKKLEHWAYRLYPKFQFQDCLKKIETLGKKRPVMVQLHKIRTDQLLSEETVVQKDSSDDEAQPPQEEDEFDKLLQQQIDLARATPGPGSVKKIVRSDQWEKLVETPVHDDRSPSVTLPKATSSPSMTDDQKERMLRNRKLAEERRLARLKQTTSMNNSTTNNTIIEINVTVPDSNVKSNVTIRSDISEVIDENFVSKKNNRSNVIDSSDSDEECNMTAVNVNEPIVVDIHHIRHTTEDNHRFKSVQDDRNTHETDDNIEDILMVDDNSKNDKDNDINVISNNDSSNTVNIVERSNNESDIGDKDDDVIREKEYDDKKSNNTDCVIDNDNVTVTLNDNENKDTNDIVDSNEINDNIESNKDLDLTSENDYVIAQNIVDKARSEQTEQNTLKLAVDDNIHHKETLKNLTEIMDVNFSDEF